MLKRLLIALLLFATVVSWAIETTPVKRVVVVGGDYNFPPYEFLDDNQIPSGYCVELSKLIAAEMGFEVRFRLGKWSRVNQWLDDNEIDAVEGMAFSAERAQKYKFSNPHTSTWRAVFVRKGSFAKSLEDLKSAQLVLQQGDISQEALHDIGFTGIKIDVPSQVDALQLLNSGKFDATIVNYMSGMYTINHLGLTNLVALPNAIQRKDYCYASKDLNIINDINTGLTILSNNGSLQKLHDKWFGDYSPQKQARKSLFKKFLVILIPAVLFIIISLLWIWFIKRKIKLQTLDLSRELKDRMLIENELRKEYQIFVSGPVIVYKVGLDPMKFLYISDNIDQFGYRSKDLIYGHETADMLIYEGDRVSVMNHLERTLANHETIDIQQYRIMAADGSLRWVSDYSMITFPENGDDYIYGYLLDITDQKKQEAELVEAKERSETANIAKGNFLANMSHEIRTPLNGIMGFINVLRQTKCSPIQKGYTDILYAAAKTLKTAVNDILDFSKIQSGEMELSNSSFDLKHVIHEVTKSFTNSRELTNIDIHYKINENLPTMINGDMLRLRQIFINLIQNALIFTSEGWIELSADLYTQNDRELRIIFCVSDTGGSIEPAKQQDIFDQFIPTDPSSPAKMDGGGFGLSIVKRLVELMNGFIWVESDAVRITSFYFIIPFNKTASAPPQDNRYEIVEESAIKVDTSLNILIVEDEPINQIVTTKQLERWNHHITIANNGAQAVELYKSQMFDCILMDIQMPVMDGVTATRIIRALEKELARHTPIIAFTAAAMVGDRERFLDAGMDDYLSKPVDIKTLGAILQRVIEDK